jgi:hypothetical protein
VTADCAVTRSLHPFRTQVRESSPGPGRVSRRSLATSDGISMRPFGLLALVTACLPAAAVRQGLRLAGLWQAEVLG